MSHSLSNMTRSLAVNPITIVNDLIRSADDAKNRVETIDRDIMNDEHKSTLISGLDKVRTNARSVIVGITTKDLDKMFTAAEEAYNAAYNTGDKIHKQSVKNHRLIGVATLFTKMEHKATLVKKMVESVHITRRGGGTRKRRGKKGTRRRR